MKTTVLKCDRCKKETDMLVEFSFINRNIQLDEETKGKSTFAEMWGFGSGRKYPTAEGDLCLDCVEDISHWLGHQENSLTGRNKDIVKN